MNKSSTDKLEQLIEHNKQMLIDAEAGCWQQLTDSEVIRQRLIKEVYPINSDVYNVVIATKATRAILQINEKIKEIVSAARDHINKEITDLGKSKVAVNAYVKNMR